MRVTLKRLLAPALLVGALVAPLAGAAQAQSSKPRSINGRERRQEQRIRQGERSGELTRSEAERLQAEQARIRVDEAYARRSGGELTAKERARIEREESKASKDIYKQKHDAQENERREERREEWRERHHKRS
ncbi:MAG: hypothetical protein QOE33_308 [Acidobacteriota bacterium]|nr:hypothetical protein [Acidobacteriota bacterium]